MPTEDAYSLRTPGPIPFGICICSSNHTTYFWRLPNMTCLSKFTLPNWRGFNRTYATGVACQQGTLTPPDTWSCPTLGLACVLMSRSITPELVLSPDFWISNIPRYFSFASQVVKLLCLAKDNWWGLSTWNSHMVHIVTSIWFNTVYTLVEVSFYIYITWLVSLLFAQWVSEGTWSQVTLSPSIDL